MPDISPFLSLTILELTILQLKNGLERNRNWKTITLKDDYDFRNIPPLIENVRRDLHCVCCTRNLESSLRRLLIKKIDKITPIKNRDA